MDFDVLNHIQPGEYSMGGAKDGYGYERVSHVVNVNWNSEYGKWNVNDWNRDNKWNAGNRVFSPENERFLLTFLVGSFCFNSLLPSADLPADFIYSFRECCVFFIIQNVKFPCNAHKKLQHIYASDCSIKCGEFIICRLIRGNRNKLEHIQKTSIYFISKSVPGLFRKMIAVAVPSLVYCKRMLNHRKHFIHTYDDIITVENILAAWQEFVPGKRKKEDVLEFQAHLMDNILKLHQDLRDGTYRHDSYIAFKISDPKPRDIHKATVKDRLLHHVLYRKLCPFFDRTWVSDSYSCRNQKGTHRAMDRFHLFAGKVSKNHTHTCWVLKCDIRKFFASIDHQILLKVIVRYIPDQRILGLFSNIIGSFYSTRPGVGLPLGNLTSQLLVNVFMNEFDQFVKHKLKAKYYIRYADDFVFLSEDKHQLEELLPYVQDFLTTELKLSLHPDKVYIKTFASGVDFLGWVHFPTHRVLRAASRKRMIRNLAEGRSESRLQSYRGFLSHGNAKKLSTLYLE